MPLRRCKGASIQREGIEQYHCPSGLRQADGRKNTKEQDDGDQTKRFTGAGKGSADYFTGTVRIDPLFEAPVPARARGASVTFEPGAARSGSPIRSIRR
jgi:hypothetical protein